MKYWEFLIQREGDPTWLPLAAQQAEIVAGRYRVAAHTDRVNAPLEIRVSQLIADEMPPRRQVRKRTGKTDQSGIVMVMPYATLQSGLWELACSSLNVMDDLMGDGWQYGLQLQVLPAAGEDGHGRQPNLADLAAVSSADSKANTVVNKDLPLMQAQAHLPNGSGQGQSANTAPASELAGSGYRVSLRQQAYLAQQDQPLTIVGKVDSLSEQRQEVTSQLWISLQDPQTAEVIMEAHRPLSLAHLPADFKVQIQLPAEVTTRLLWGEVSLRAAATDPADENHVLTSTAFTITAGIDRLLEAIASQESSTFDEEISVTSASQPPINQNGSAPSSGYTPTPVLDPTPRPAAPSVGGVPPDEARPTDQPRPQPELPSFAPPTATPPVAHSLRPSMVSQPAQFVGTSIENDDLEADEIAAVLEDIDQDLRLEDSDLDAFEPPEMEVDLPADEFDEPLPDQRSPAPENRRPRHQDKAHVAFQSLKLKDHFWQRLSALTHESHQEAAKVVRGMEAAGLSRERSSDLPTVSEFALDDEVVIYDQPPAATRSTFTPPPIAPAAEQQTSPAQPLAQPTEPIEWPRRTNSQSSRTPAPPRQVTPEPAARAESLEMALPVISVPMGDLIAGETITITVRTRPSAYRPFIRLWMIDRQSRSLVGEPQTLTNLLPDALGDLQSAAELRVPMDCLDVQIAAIAVDMATRQESGKAVVNRHVVPANQPPSSSFRL